MIVTKKLLLCAVMILLLGLNVSALGLMARPQASGAPVTIIGPRGDNIPVNKFFPQQISLQAAGRTDTVPGNSQSGISFLVEPGVAPLRLGVGHDAIPLKFKVLYNDDAQYAIYNKVFLSILASNEEERQNMLRRNREAQLPEPGISLRSIPGVGPDAIVPLNGLTFDARGRLYAKTGQEMTDKSSWVAPGQGDDGITHTFIFVQRGLYLNRPEITPGRLELGVEIPADALGTENLQINAYLLAFKLEVGGWQSFLMEVPFVLGESTTLALTGSLCAVNDLSMEDKSRAESAIASVGLSAKAGFCHLEGGVAICNNPGLALVDADTFNILDVYPAIQARWGNNPQELARVVKNVAFIVQTINGIAARNTVGAPSVSFQKSDGSPRANVFEYSIPAVARLPENERYPTHIRGCFEPTCRYRDAPKCMRITAEDSRYSGSYSVSCSALANTIGGFWVPNYPPRNSRSQEESIPGKCVFGCATDGECVPPIEIGGSLT